MYCTTAKLSSKKTEIFFVYEKKSLVGSTPGRPSCQMLAAGGTDDNYVIEGVTSKRDLNDMDLQHGRYITIS